MSASGRKAAGYHGEKRLCCHRGPGIELQPLFVTIDPHPDIFPPLQALHSAV